MGTYGVVFAGAASETYARMQPTLKRFPALERKFTAVIINFFRQAMVPTTKLVTDMVM